MKSRLSTIAIAGLLLAGLSTLEANSLPHDSLPTSEGPDSSKVSARSLDLFVRKYAKVVRFADSVESLRDYLPTARMKKFRVDFSDRQKSDWLSFRKQMPLLGKLVSQNVHGEKAVFIYETPDEYSTNEHKRQKRMAAITLVKEKGNWKISHEHFGPAKEIMSTKARSNH